MNSVIKFSAFNPDPFGHGGARRSAQIDEILTCAGIDLCMANHQICLDTKRSFAEKFGDVVLDFKERRQHSRRIYNYSSRNSRLPNDLRQFRETLKRFPDINSIVWESHYGNNFLVAKLAGCRGLFTVALPHNLESLVPTQSSPITGQAPLSWLSEEINYLAAAAHVFSISREDQWLLRLHNIEADYLPYYPPKVTESWLKDIRKVRQSNKITRDKILLMGTATNPPTRQGMMTVLHSLDAILSHDANFELVVVGLGTEKLQLPAFSLKANIRGWVPKDEFFDLLVSSRAVLVYQTPTSGALTRITEMLLAGLPVVANTNAARSFYHMSGVYICDDLHEVAELIEQIRDMPGQPNRPARAEQRFARLLLERLRDE